MSAIHIFKAGTHTDMHGKKLPFTPDDLAACVKAYDPSVHEAPLVIGHPRTEDPGVGLGESPVAQRRRSDGRACPAGPAVC